MSTGCFRMGRLCGFGNANILGFACVALILLSAFCFLDFRKTAGKCLFVLPFALGCFCLGMTNCRTGIVGISAAFGASAFAFFMKKAGKLRLAVRIPLGVLTMTLITFTVSQLFYLPTAIFQGVMRLYGQKTENAFLLRNLNDLVTRRISENDGTVADRVITWKTVIKYSLANGRRALFGNSPITAEHVFGITPGRHDALVPHAHNTFLEVLRRSGFPGLVFLTAETAIWCVTGARRFFDGKERFSVRFLMSSAAVILLMGIVEQVPFAFASTHFLDFPFFIICGYCMNRAEKQSTVKAEKEKTKNDR